MLEKMLEKSWSKESSSDSDSWSVDNLSKGQCAVTALVVQDYLGGEILNMSVSVDNTIESHYVNIFKGKIVDLTAKQFGDVELDYSQAKPKTKEFPSTREYLLSNKDTKARYNLLKISVMKNYIDLLDYF